MSQFPTIQVQWGDPDLPNKFRSFFLETYRARMHEEKEHPSEATSDGAPTNDEDSLFHLDLNNLPDEHLSAEQFTFLMKVRADIRRWFARPMKDTDDPLLAGIILTRRCFLYVTVRLIEQLLLYLLLDSRYHPDYPIHAKAIGMFTYEGGVDEEWRRVLTTMTTCMAGCNLLTGNRTGCALLSDEMRLLHLAGDAVFDTLQSIFPIRAVTKCRMAFTLLMRDLGTCSACDQVENYIRRRKTLYREMVAYTTNGGIIGNAETKPPVENTETLDENTKADNENKTAIGMIMKKLEKMDRRQRLLFTFLKNAINGFILLFHPGTRAKIAEMISSSDRYVALKNYEGTRYDQLKAVIDMTYSNPIVHREDKRGYFTLASAALAVWQREHDKWKKEPDAFKTIEQLKVACYALAKDPRTNPFVYRQIEQ